VEDRFFLTACIVILKCLHLTESPTEEITVSAWFLTDSFDPQVLISTHEDGGYRLGFDDGQDLWWTLQLVDTREVSIPLLHEGISLNEWHHITATYDGQIMRIYLDGVLRNQMNATGAIPVSVQQLCYGRCRCGITTRQIQIAHNISGVGLMRSGSMIVH